MEHLDDLGCLADSGEDEEKEEGGSSRKLGGAKQAKKGAPDSSSAAAGPNNRKVTSVMKDNKILFSLIIKQLLAVAQASRDTAQVLFDILLIPCEMIFIVTAISQNTLYNKKLQKLGKGHGLGPPFLWTSQGVLAGLAKQLKTADSKENLSTITEIVKTWNSLSSEEKADTLRFCRVVKNYDTSTKKLVMNWGRASSRKSGAQL